MQPNQRGDHQGPVSIDRLASMSFDDMRSHMEAGVASMNAMASNLFDLEPFPPRPRRGRDTMGRIAMPPFGVQLPPMPHPPGMTLHMEFDMEPFPPLPTFHSHFQPHGVAMPDMSYESLMNLQDVRRGVEQPDIARLKRTRFSTNLKCKQCGICQDNFSNGCKVITLPCDHVFCEAEILKWFETNKTCPTCRFVVENIRVY